MLPPKTPQNVSRSQPRTSSSKPTKTISKPRCEAWVPLSGWEQSDEAENDIFYLAIDAWAKRNSKIKTDAPKGVPSSKIWEPFLCTTSQQCTGILDFDAFVNVSLSLHKDIEVESKECQQDMKTNLGKDSNGTSKADSNEDDVNGKKIEQDKIQAEQLKKEKCHSEKNTNDHSDKKESDNSDNKEKGHLDKKKNDHYDKKENGYSDTPKLILPDAEKGQHKDNRSFQDLDKVTYGPTPVEGGDGDETDSGNILDWMARNGTSHSAPVSRTQQREPPKRRVGSAKTKSAEDRLRRAALKNSTKSKVSSKKVSVPANPVKISYAHSGNSRAGIFAGELPMSEAVDNAESEGTENTPSEPPTSDAARRTSLDNRLLIEEVIKDSKKIDYMSKTSVVSIGDLLSSAPRLERRQGQHSNSRDSMYAAMTNEDDGTASRESFGTWSSPRPSEDIRSPSSSSLPPVPVASRNTTPVREVHSSNSPRSEGRTADPRQTVNLNSAKIPVISYRKGARRDSEGNGEDGSIRQDRRPDLDDVRYIKRLLKSALAREKSRVHSAGYVRQVQQINDSTTHLAAKSGGKKGDQKSELQVDCDRDKNRILSQVLGKHRFVKRGPPAFRPQSFKTPLQRAVENAHKKIYGQHYYLFNNNSGTGGMENVEDMRNGVESAKGLRTQSANGETTNAYVWKENIESQQRHRRKAYSGSEKTRAKTTNGRAGYNVSDFKPNFKADALKTDRRKTIQR